MYCADKAEISWQHVWVEVSESFAVNSKRSQNQIRNADGAFTFFSSEQQKTFTWVKLSSAYENRFQDFPWKLHHDWLAHSGIHCITMIKAFAVQNLRVVATYFFYVVTPKIGKGFGIIINKNEARVLSLIYFVWMFGFLGFGKLGFWI